MKILPYHLMADRLDEARHEILQAIECELQPGHVVEPWESQAILADIELADGKPTSAADARGKAIALYLAYRRQGGENHAPPVPLILTVTQSLREGAPVATSSLLEQLTNDSKATSLRALAEVLQSVAAGSREPALAEAPGLTYTMVAEVLLMLETLERSGKNNSR